MKRLTLGLLALIIFGCSSAQENFQQMDSVMSKPASLPDLGLAPELTNMTWLNTESSLRLADLRGRVVLLEMWTFGCINCRNVMPSLKDWHGRYKDEGLVIIGNHYPEFSYEEDLSNLKEAIERNKIEYAVAQDNDGATWRAYQNRYWPTLYLIDKQGHLRYVHIGEGRYRETEENIKALLEEEYKVSLRGLAQSNLLLSELAH